MRYELSDYEWTAIKPMLPNKSHGVRRVNDRRVLNGIFWVLRSGAPWRDLPPTYGPRTTSCNRFVRWRQAGVWDQIMDTLAVGHESAVQMIDTSVVRVHQHGACISDNNQQDMGRSRGGLTCKIHAVVDTNGLARDAAGIAYLIRSLLRYGLAVRCGLDTLCSISQNIQTKAAPRPITIIRNNNVSAGAVSMFNILDQMQTAYQRAESKPQPR
jgi:transposase